MDIDEDEYETLRGMIEKPLHDHIATLTAERAAFKDTAQAMTDKVERAIEEVKKAEAERDRLQAIVDNLPAWIRKWWKFDQQQPASTWHEREDFIEELQKLLDGKPSLLSIKDR